jgi:hypothetical protein
MADISMPTLLCQFEFIFFLLAMPAELKDKQKLILPYCHNIVYLSFSEVNNHQLGLSLLNISTISNVYHTKNICQDESSGVDFVF